MFNRKHSCLPTVEQEDVAFRDQATGSKVESHDVDCLKACCTVCDSFCSTPYITCPMLIAMQLKGVPE